MKAEIQTFTPDRARDIVKRTIEANANFRNPTTTRGGKGKPAFNIRVYKYAEHMRGGTWEWTQAAPIRLTDDNLCTDGLHRLAACAMSDVPLQALVLRGDTWNAGIYTDHHQARTLGQTLAHRGVANASAKAAICRLFLARTIAWEQGRGCTPRLRDQFVTDTACLNLEERYRDELSAIVGMKHVAQRRGLNGTDYVTFQLELMTVDSAVGFRFHESLKASETETTLSALEPSDPLNQLVRQTMRYKKTTNRIHAAGWTINQLVKAFDHREAGVSLSVWRAAQWDDVRYPAGYSPKDRTTVEDDDIYYIPAPQ